MKINKIILLAIMLSFIANAALAQESLSNKELANYQNSLMIKELILSKEQSEIVSEVNLKYTTQLNTLMQREGSMFGKLGEMREIKNGKESELKAVLTKTQMEKYKNYIEPDIKSFLKKNIKH